MKHSPTLGALVSTKLKCIKLIVIGKITLVPVAFLKALSIYMGLGSLDMREELQLTYTHFCIIMA